jgi:hypothetical protein
MSDKAHTNIVHNTQDYLLIPPHHNLRMITIPFQLLFFLNYHIVVFGNNNHYPTFSSLIVDY